MSKKNERKNFATLLVKQPPDQFKAIFEATPVALVEGFWGKVFEPLAVNQAALDLFDTDNRTQFLSGFGRLIGKIPHKVLLELLSARLKGDLFEAEFPLHTFKRKTIFVFMRLAYVPDRQFGPQHVVLAFHDITSRKKQETFLKRLTQLDSMTGLLNHKTIIERLDEEISRARRYKVDVSCVILDLDNFKEVNDSFGHLAGDKYIRRAAKMLKEVFRKTDIVGRYGGDEFLVILPETKAEHAVIPIRRFLASYEANAEIKSRERSLTTSFSVGVASFPTQGIETAKDLIQSADEALYESKTKGGHCCSIYASNSSKSNQKP